MKKTKLVFTSENEKAIQEAIRLTGTAKGKEFFLKDLIKKSLTDFKKEYPRPCFPDAKENKERRQSLKKIFDATKSLLASFKDKDVFLLDFIKIAWPNPTNPLLLMDRVGYSEIEILRTRELLLKLQISTSSVLDCFLPPKSRNGREGKSSNRIFLALMALIWLSSNKNNKVTAYADSKKNKFIEFLDKLYAIIYPDIAPDWEKPIKAFVKNRKNLGTLVSQKKRS